MTAEVPESASTRGIAQIFNLPNEILTEILHHLHPTDLLKVTQCCRLMHQLSEPHLMRLRYGTISVACERRTPLLPTPTRILHDVLLNPSIVKYVTCLEFIGQNSPYCMERCATPHLHLKKALIRSPYIKKKDRSSWRSRIIGGDQDSAFALLLTLLTNVLDLVLCSGWPGPCTQTMVSKIVRHFHKVKVYAALVKLETVRIYNSFSDRAFKMAALFAELPSLRCINGSWWWSCEEELWPLDLEACFADIEEINICYSNIAPPNIMAFLANFKDLRHFYYHVQCEVIWDPNAIREALFVHARDTLEVLSLDCKDWFMLREFIGSLREFRKLKAIGLDYHLLIDGNNPCRLVDIFPASAEEISLYDLEGGSKKGRMSQGVAAHLLSDLPELKVVHLPNLRKILTYSPIIKFLQAPCEAVGINFELDKRNQMKRFMWGEMI